MPSPVRQSQFRAGVGVAIAAEVRTGVLRADVLADDTILHNSEYRSRIFLLYAMFVGLAAFSKNPK